MPDASTNESQYEEAKRCPKCGQPGEVRKIEPAPRSANLPAGTKIHTVYCQSTLCPWSGEVCRLIQVNPDGSIPPPQNHTRSQKLYHGFEGHDEEAKRIVDNLRRQQEASTQPGTEIRNPNG